MVIFKISFQQLWIQMQYCSQIDFQQLYMNMKPINLTEQQLDFIQALHINVDEFNQIIEEMITQNYNQWQNSQNQYSQNNNSQNNQQNYNQYNNSQNINQFNNDSSNITQQSYQQNNKSKLQLELSQSAFAILFIQFQQFLIDFKQVSLYFMTKEMVNENPQKQDFFNKLNIKYYSSIKLYWLQFLENNAAYLLVFNMLFLNKQLKLIETLYNSKEKKQRSNKNIKQHIVNQGKFIAEPIKLKKIKMSNQMNTEENLNDMI
ncbi:hypothetical protein pb186bvf_020409 [Paramecium bursaria]